MTKPRGSRPVSHNGRRRGGAVPGGPACRANALRSIRMFGPISDRPDIGRRQPRRPGERREGPTMKRLRMALVGIGTAPWLLLVACGNGPPANDIGPVQPGGGSSGGGGGGGGGGAIQT